MYRVGKKMKRDGEGTIQMWKKKTKRKGMGEGAIEVEIQCQKQY
jgi:hypothetical protein